MTYTTIIGANSRAHELANARLIAAAPNLLAALKAIADTSVGIDEKNGCQRAWSECCKIACAAIAKAERS